MSWLEPFFFNFIFGKEEYALKTRKKIEVQDNAC